jgi:ketosteroid isomerase-like protein
MSKTLIRISVIAVFCACAIAFLSNAVSAGIPDNAKMLAALDDEWSKAATAGDVEKVVSFYADDAVVYPPNEPIVSDPAAIKESWAKMLADPKAKLSWKTTHAGVDHNTGFTSGTYQVAGADGAVLEKGKYLCVWGKGKDGKWKSLHDMWNRDSK